ncbi:MAG: 30S ribosome-binding factor RbfA [Pirellulaceae bacterium]
MTSRRVLKAAEAIREVVSMAILTELRDPRVRDVTVTYVEVSGDMRHAKVHVSVMGDEAKQKLTIRGLENASGFLQQKINTRIETRYTPRLKFVLDQGVKHSLEVSRILDEVLPRDAEQANTEQANTEQADAQQTGAEQTGAEQTGAVEAEPSPAENEEK